MAEQKEILESIRDIVAGGGDNEDDEILDLTEMVNPDGSTSHIEPKTKVAKSQEPAENDVMSEIDSLAKTHKLREEEVNLVEFQPKTEKFEIKQEFEPGDVIAPRSDNLKENQEDNMSDDLDTIISGDSATAARTSISELTKHLKNEGKEANRAEPGAPFRNGDTVEDLVVEMLKPMMKDWLDKNLPKLVNEIVQKEIQKLIPRD